MPSPYPGALAPNPRRQFLDEEGNPLAGGLLYSYLAGTTTPEAVFADALLTTPHSNPITLDAAGRVTYYVDAKGYKFKLLKATNELVWEVDNVEDLGQVFLKTLGVLFSTGSRDVVSGYVVDPDDNIVTVNSTGGADPCVITLEPASGDSARKRMLAVKNKGNIEVALTPQAGETIDGVVGAYTIPVAASPLFPCVWIAPDGTGNWDIIGSHGI